MAFLSPAAGGSQFALPKTPKPVQMGGNNARQVMQPKTPAGPAGLMGGGAAGPVRQMGAQFQNGPHPNAGPGGMMGIAGGALNRVGQPQRPPTGGPMQPGGPAGIMGGALNRVPGTAPQPQTYQRPFMGMGGAQPNPGALAGIAGGAINRVGAPQGGPAGAFGALAGVQQRPMANVAQRPLRGLLGGM